MVYLGLQDDDEYGGYDPYGYNAHDEQYGHALHRPSSTSHHWSHQGAGSYLK